MVFSFVLFCEIQKLFVGCPAGIGACETIVPAGRANRGGHNLIGQKYPFTGQQVNIGSEVLAFALRKRIEHMGIHIIGNEKDDVWFLLL